MAPNESGRDGSSDREFRRMVITVFEEDTQRAGEEMPKCLRPLALLLMTQVQFPALQWQLTTTCNSSPRDLMPSSRLGEHQACRWYTYMHARRTLIHIKKEKRLEPGGCSTPFKPSPWEAEASEFEVSPVYRASSRTARAAQRSPVSKN